MSLRPIVLASGSASRRAILAAADVPFDIIRPDVDEDAVKTAMTGEGAQRLAETLAAKKALAVAAPGALVIGSDQVLVCGRERFSKVASLPQARAVLQSLRGREHQLVTAVALACDKNLLWQYCETVTLTMRDFSDSFLDEYLAKEGDACLSSVGCYRLEGLGAQLFSSVAGDHFTGRGLPLFATLSALRRHGGLPS